MSNDDLRINFTEVEDQKDWFRAHSPSRQTVMVTDWNESEVTSPDAKNYGAPKLTFELTVQGGDFDNRRIWDTFTVAASSFWKLKNFLKANGEDVNREWTLGEIREVCPDFIGRELVVKLAVQPSRKDERTGNEYSARNQVKDYFPADAASSNGSALLP